jgi:hypothetical protein
MRILKQTHHPQPLVIQPHNVLMPLLFKVLSSTVRGLLETHNLLVLLQPRSLHLLLPPQAFLILKMECKEISKFILQNGMKIKRITPSL